MQPTGEFATNPKRLDVSQVIENLKGKRFAVVLIVITFFLSLLEGFDVGVISYVAPVLIKTWNLSPKLFGIIFGAGMVGLMFGGLVFGLLADKIGRKKSLMIGIIWFSIFTLASIFANSLTTLLYLRVLACFGLGGTVPISIVLVNEFSPKQSRGKWVAYMFMGFSFGQFVGGMLSAWLLPNFGWKSVFIFGGLAPLLMLIPIYYKLPESLRFLVVNNKDRGEIVKVISCLQPGIAIGPDTEFIVADEKKAAKLSPKMLFTGTLLIITPLIWLVYITNSSTLYFMNSWLPQLQVASGFTVKQASMSTAVYFLGGVFSTLVVGWVFDKRGMLALSIFPLVSILVMASLGFPKGAGMTLISLLVAGFFLVGTQAILTITVPTFYPTAIRASANGLAMSIAKIGSIAGPIIGGILISAKLSLKELYFINSGVLVISLIIIVALGILSKRMYDKVDDSNLVTTKTVQS